MRRQFTMGRRSNPPASRRGQPDLKQQFEVVHPDITQATRVASAKLAELGVRHVLVGGMAVGAYARPRATKDVDFMVGPEAWPTEGVIVSAIPGLPFRVGKIDVDTLMAPGEAPGIVEALERGITSENIPIVPPEVLILMKVIAGRAQDIADIHALLDVVPVTTARAYVQTYAPDYLDNLNEILTERARTKNLSKKLSR